ncbi:MAG: DUF86 domain-containing protein [Methanosarcinales archaeon]|uniref:DUF86 domain-containing protein n=1 Tax=Candidatus Ethanoperedens thermophilum TaxID=2766897 RepID=A0A848DAD8_9EURY|nr:DUF86 domain-containing protein [Candidatus Ethanoperedens thermophilum]
MSERGDAEFLGDIKEAAARIEIYIEGMNYEQFLEDIKTQDAVVRNLEIIGEAAKNISDDVKERHPQIVWKKLAGVRDRLVHHYFGVNYDIVWVIVKKELPEVILQIEMLWSGEKI